jgi:hypothetical protein
MNFNFQRIGGGLFFVGLSLFTSACSKDGGPLAPANSQYRAPVGAQAAAQVGAPLAAGTQSTAPRVAAPVGGSTNGAAGEMPAFHDGVLVTVNMKEEPKAASEALLQNGQNPNEIYASNDLDDEQDFIPVIDAIQGDAFNPLWRQVLIVFNTGFTPHQFKSDDEVEAAASGARPEITLVETDEFYRCSVVGTK